MKSGSTLNSSSPRTETDLSPFQHHETTKVSSSIQNPSCSLGFTLEMSTSSSNELQTASLKNQAKTFLFWLMIESNLTLLQILNTDLQCFPPRILSAAQLSLPCARRTTSPYHSFFTILLGFMQWVLFNYQITLANSPTTHWSVLTRFWWTAFGVINMFFFNHHDAYGLTSIELCLRSLQLLTVFEAHGTAVTSLMDWPCRLYFTAELSMWCKIHPFHGSHMLSILSA